MLSKKIEGLSDRTLAIYAKVIKEFGTFIEKPVNQISIHDIRKWLFKHSGLKISTIRYYISVIRSFFFYYLVNEELVAVDPTRRIKLAKLGEKIAKALNINEL